MPFKTIHSDYGLGFRKAGEAVGTPINLPEVAVGLTPEQMDDHIKSAAKL